MKLLQIGLSVFMLIVCRSTFAQLPGENIFDDTYVHSFHFYFDQVSYWDSLTANYPTEIYMIGNMNIDGLRVDSVGVRLKGNSSYIFYPGDKKSLKIDFNEYRDELTFDGLKKINLNNNYLDPTFLREKLTLDFLKQRGLPAPRSSFARVYLNDVYWGLYTVIEQIDKTFLKSTFGNNDGNLFKAISAPMLLDPENDYSSQFELKTNEEENDWSDLIAFVELINKTSEGSFHASLADVFNLEPYLATWAVNNLFVNIDSYMGSGHNYYLYHNTDTNQFEWISWDFNHSFGASDWTVDEISQFDIYYLPPVAKRPLNERILTVETLKGDYTEFINAFVEDGFNEAALFPRIDHFINLIRDDVYADTKKMFSNEAFEKNILQTVHYMIQDTYPATLIGLKELIKKRVKFLKLVSSLTTTDSERQSVDNFNLFQNYPNPFNASTVISYSLQQQSKVELKILNTGGQEISKLVDKVEQPGRHSIVWDGRNALGRPVSSGLYFVQARSNNQIQSRSILLVK